MLGHGHGSAPSSLPRQDPSTPAREEPRNGLIGRERARPERPPLPRSVDGLPDLGPDFWPLIDEALPLIGIELTNGARRAIDAQARLLLAWNAAINLTALGTTELIARRHVIDSLAALPALRRLLDAGPLPTSSVGVLDLGSGAGYPGLPVAVALPAGHCALVDSVAKKARFLRVATAAAALAMRAEGEPQPSFVALAERAEDLADEPAQRERWQLVLARALGSLAEVIELAVPLLAIGGHMAAWKRDVGDGSLETELAEAGPLLRACGATRPRITSLDETGRLGLPGHVLVVVRKARATPHQFPRPPAARRRALLT